MARNIFNTVMTSKVPGSNFNLSHQVKTSFEIGELIPTMVQEVLPGDRWEIGTEVMGRLAPMIAPPYANLELTTHYFFVPNRIMWPEWEDWITGKSEVEHPYVSLGTGLSETNSIASYLGYKGVSGLKQNAFPQNAYFMIYDEYYRAQHIQTDEEWTELNAGGNSGVKAFGTPLRRAWQHDYFTSALPFPQVGEAVELPVLSQEAIDVQLKDALGSGNQQLWRDSGGNLDTNLSTVTQNNDGVLRDSNGLAAVWIDPNSSLEVDFSGIIPDINSLREALALQRIAEKEARAGQRYIEWNMSFFGQKSSDGRFSRPEYIHGHKQNFQISEVLQTAEGSEPVGQMLGHGISVGGSKRRTFAAEEHGWIIGITSVLPKTGYYQGVHRSISHRVDRYDYANPMFANLGEQEVYNKEVYIDDSMSLEQLNETFGYVPRFAEYKTMYNIVQGEFKSTLEYWHMDRKFNTSPTLSPEFIECEHDNRNFATVTGNDTIYCLIQNNLKVYRKLPKYGIPSIVG